MRLASLDHTPSLPVRRPARASTSVPERSRHVGRLEAPPVSVATPAPVASPYSRNGLQGTELMPTVPTASAPAAWTPLSRVPGLGAAEALHAFPAPFPTHASRTGARPATSPDPDVFLVALPLAGGGLRALEGAGRQGAIRVSRPYGHLRSIRPVILDTAPAYSQAAATGHPDRASVSANLAASQPSITGTQPRRARHGTGSGISLGSATVGAATTLPARRPMPQVVSAVEVETDAGVFRVERPGGVLAHSDMAWAMAHLEAGEPDSLVPLPRRQLALLLTLLPTPEDPDHPEDDPTWGWAHRLRGPWERGPLHGRGRLGRLIAFDPDDTGKGMHRACFELLGSDEVVWAVGVPCFRTGSVYELTPLGKGISPSRWLSWPLPKGRKRVGAPDRPKWEIARVVFRVGMPRWPLAGVVEPLGPMGIAG